MKTDRIDTAFMTIPATGRPRWLRRLVALVAVVAAAAGAVYVYAPQYLPHSLQFQSVIGGRGGRGGQGAEAPVPVLVAAARKENVPVYFDGVGTSRALNTVTVRAQVDGKLMSVNFKEGQDVDSDFVLAEIDPTIYRAQLDQAIAKKAMDEALLGNARIDLERYAKLTATNSATRQQYDTQKALVAQLEAQVQADQGAIENAKAILSYTRIIAPIAGRTGLRLVDAGNIVHAVDTTGIVVITQIRPIAIIFTLPQQQLAQVNRAFAEGALSVQALADDNRSVVDRGKLVVVDNQVDQTTGTVKLKAEFPNETLQLWPGQFVNVKLLVDTLQDATVVPTAAVQRGPNGTFVYIANDDDTVSVRPVTVSQEDDSNAVLVSGAAAGERVVTTGFAQLKDGTRIAIGTPENLERPAGSERRRRGPITGAPVAQVDQKPAASAAPAAQAQEKPPGTETVGAEKPSPPPAAAAATIGEAKRAETPAATSGETPRAGPQRRSETRSPTASP
ncbi:MAG TPA: efflux RND transporter periplasmic adaptor subunit [Xanthobacteraceae bacterium]|nr:efflux RND transporter periplasmic adaptor subunit [Xanthobacteraceae bacterium]